MTTVVMRHRWILFLLLQLIWSRCARSDQDDRNVDRVVFGIEGETVSFTNPDGEWWNCLWWRWPTALNNRIASIGLHHAGFAIRDFRPEDQGRKYTANFNGVVNYYRAMLATRIEVDIGATLHITPEISGEINTITWKYTPTSVTKATKFVEVLGHSAFEGRARVDATGKLSVSDWSLRDDGFFTASINGENFAVNFMAVSVVRLKIGEDLHLDPDLPDSVGHIKQFSWYRDLSWTRDNIPVVEFDESVGTGVVYNLPCLTDKSNCYVDTTTGKLTVKSWQSAYDGVFTPMVNSKLQKKKFKVVGDVAFVSLSTTMQLNPPPFEGKLERITWRYGGKMIAMCENGTLLYDTVVCNPDTCVKNCILDKTTGMLTVKMLDHTPEKKFTWELNGRIMPTKFVVIKNLSDYAASVKVEYFTPRLHKLICVGYFDGAEPVKYFWRLHGPTPIWV